jgi:hypothetical protein
MTECLLAHSDAAYVLGALSPVERLEYEKHLPGCEACRASVAGLAGMPGLLGRVTREQVESPAPFEPLPDTVLPALVAAVRREQRRKTLMVTLGAAAAVAVVGLGIGVLQAGHDDGRTPVAVPPATTATSAPTPAPKQAMQVIRDYGVTAEVSLTARDWGTDLSLDCAYAAREGGHGSDHAYDFKLVVFTEYGGHEAPMTWTAKAGDSFWGLKGATKFALPDITKVEVQSEHGDPILRLKL